MVPYFDGSYSDGLFYQRIVKSNLCSFLKSSLTWKTNKVLESKMGKGTFEKKSEMKECSAGASSPAFNNASICNWEAPRVELDKQLS